MQITKDSRIVEVFSSELRNNVKDKNELKDAHEYIQELASRPSPERLYEIAQIMTYVIDDGLNDRVNYLDLIADVKRTGFGEKAQFRIDIDGLKAFWQAKSSTTERSQVSTQYVQLETDEVSIRPQVNHIDLATGKVNLTDLADKAARKMEIAIAKRIQDAVYAAFKDIGETPNYAAGSGITKGTFDQILYAMKRAGGNASIVGDVEALAKFAELTGFSGKVADAIAIEQNQNGHIGNYIGSPLVQLDNPFQPHSLTQTELRKDLIYVIPNVEEGLMPVKVQFEGDVQSIGAPTDINSKLVEFRFDQYVGVGVVGARKLLGVYEDQQLSQ